MTLGQRIQELRKQAGYTQEQLAERLGVTRQAVSKWESDNGVPELDTLIAMSRLFGVTVGQLLGVEEPGREQGGPSRDGDDTDARVEAILRRYAEQTRRQQPAAAPGRHGWQRAVIALAAAVVAALFMLMFYLLNTVSSIRNQFSSLSWDHVQQQNEINRLYGQLQDIQQEMADPVSQFTWEVLSFDPEGETADLAWQISLKEYSMGAQVQLMLTGTDGEQYVSQWAQAPDFTGSLAGIPMSDWGYICALRVEEEGNVREMELEPISSLGPEQFQLRADSLAAFYAISVGSSATVTAEDPAVRIYSPYPQLFQPAWARLTVTLNGQELESVSLTLTQEGDDLWYGRDDQGVRQLRLNVGVVVEFSLTMGDSLGRETVEIWSMTAGEDGPVESPPVLDTSGRG